MNDGKKQMEINFNSGKKSQEGRVVVFDLETQRSAQEVGGWNNTKLMKVAVGVAHDSLENRYITFFEDDVDKLLTLLKSADIVVGFNSRNFDYGVLKGYTNEALEKTLPTLDILEEIQKSLGFRLKLDTVAKATLGISKSASGLESLKWFKEGKLDLIEEYCIQDVRVTRDVYLYGLEHEKLLYTDRAGKIKELSVDFSRA